MAKTPTTWNPEDVKVTRQLTTSFRMEQDKTYYLQLLSEMYVDEARGNQEETGGKKGGKGGRKYAPPTMIRALDLTDGREVDVILATLPQRRLEEGFEGNAYVGACIRITKHAPRQGKSYCDYDFDEIDGSGSPHYRDPKEVAKNAGKYGPRKTAAKK